MGSIIRFTGTVFYSLLYLNTRRGFNGLKYMHSVISVIVDSLPGNTKNRESTCSWTARVRLLHSWRECVTHSQLHNSPAWHTHNSTNSSAIIPSLGGVTPSFLTHSCHLFMSLIHVRGSCHSFMCVASLIYFWVCHSFMSLCVTYSFDVRHSLWCMCLYVSLIHVSMCVTLSFLYKSLIHVSLIDVRHSLWWFVTLIHMRVNTHSSRV